MVDKDVCVVELTQGDERYVVPREEAVALKQRLSRTAGAAPVAERTISDAGSLLTITAEEATRLEAIVGIADTPEELKKLVGWQGKRFAIYDPVDKFQIRWKPIEKKAKELGQEFQQSLTQAIAAAPHNGMYAIHPQTHQMSPDSRRQWRDRTDECIKHIKGCIQNINEMSKLIRENEDMFDEDDAAQMAQARTSFLTILDQLRRNRTARYLLR